MLRQEKINPEKIERLVHWTGLFASFILAVACLAALVLAANESTLAANINGMLGDMIGLKTAFNNQALLILSALAGVGIVIAEYGLTRATAEKALHS